MLGKLKKHSKGYSLYVKDVEIAIYDTERTERPLYSLSKENCDDIFGVVDVEKLANKYFDEPHPADEPYGAYSGFKDGFEYAMELNKEFQFTKEELVKMLIDFVGFPHDYNEPRGSIAERFVQSLQQPTEIEVEIEMDYAIYPANLPKENEERPTMMPKRDENGCLILKKK